jgi:hypothetical protein
MRERSGYNHTEDKLVIGWSAVAGLAKLEWVGAGYGSQCCWPPRRSEVMHCCSMAGRKSAIAHLYG